MSTRGGAGYPEGANEFCEDDTSERASVPHDESSVPHNGRREIR